MDDTQFSERQISDELSHLHVQRKYVCQCLDIEHMTDCYYQKEVTKYQPRHTLDYIKSLVVSMFITASRRLNILSLIYRSISDECQRRIQIRSCV